MTESLWIDDAEYPITPQRIEAWLPKARNPMDGLPDFVIPTKTVVVGRWSWLELRLVILREWLQRMDDALGQWERACHRRSRRTIPNPAYDAIRATAFCATHPTNCGRRFTIGQSYTPLTPEEREKTLSWIEGNR